MANKKDPGLFIFKEENKEASEVQGSYPSKPISNLASKNKKDEEHNPVSLYEYSLGIKNIKAEYTTYKEAEVFVTKPMHLMANVMEVELEAMESHPVFDDLSGEAIDRQTSVEYYLSYKQKPTPDDWVPILPKGEKEVRGERLFLVSNRGKLRFPAKMETINVYENGLKVDRSKFTLLNNQEVNIQRPTAGSIYTVSYKPDEYKKNPWLLQLNDYKQYVQRVTEVFEDGTDINKTISLKYTPFIDIERILKEENYNPNTSAYKPIQVRLVDASIQGKNQSIKKLIEPYRKELINEAYTYNKTLYLDKSWSDMQAYNLDKKDYYGGFDYYQWKNKLKFTEHFKVKRLAENQPYTHGNANVEVSYDALVTDFRLKIILRRNTATETTAAPRVKEYQLRFKTAD